MKGTSDNHFWEIHVAGLKAAMLSARFFCRLERICEKGCMESSVANGSLCGCADFACDAERCEYQGSDADN